MERDAGIFINDSVVTRLEDHVPVNTTEIEAFHQTLPEYAETPLISLPSIAKELSIGHVLVKDESFRLGLPSFKILGASWAVFRAVAAKLGLEYSDKTVNLETLGEAAGTSRIQLVACTDGNWGRGCSRMAKHLGIPIEIFVPKTMDKATRDRISSEGAKVIVVDGDYDAAIKTADNQARDSGALLVQDTAWPGYEEIPTWAVEGYTTLLAEADRQVRQQVDGRPVTFAIASAGVGSFAQAVTAHYKSGASQPVRVAAVEPTAAACVRASLEAGKITPIETGYTIMDGMNCGTVSSVSWPVLRRGLDACVSVTDLEAHKALGLLHSLGVKAGPCGAAPLAALRMLRDARPQWFDEDSVAMLFCTEGDRRYPVPAGG